MTTRKTNTTTIDDAALAKWIEEQRRLYKRGKLEARQIEILEQVPGWNWDPPEHERGLVR